LAIALSTDRRTERRGHQQDLAVWGANGLVQAVDVRSRDGRLLTPTLLVALVVRINLVVEPLR